jgi:hypothetical protein
MFPQIFWNIIYYLCQKIIIIIIIIILVKLRICKFSIVGFETAHLKVHEL